MQSIGILIFDDVEILDFSGPYEVFSTAARVQKRLALSGPHFRCFLVAEEMRPVRARGGMKVLPDCVLPPAADLDVLIVPGGDISRVLARQPVIDWIRAQSETVRLTASVCTGAFLLAQAGLLDGFCAATHWEDGDALSARYPRLRLRRHVPWVDCGKVVTSAGISAGLAMSLHLVERLADTRLAQATARQMEYQWESHADSFSRDHDSHLFSAAQERAGGGSGRTGGSPALCQPT